MRGAVVIIKQRCAFYALDTDNGWLRPSGAAFQWVMLGPVSMATRPHASMPVESNHCFFF